MKTITKFVILFLVSLVIFTGCGTSGVIDITPDNTSSTTSTGNTTSGNETPGETQVDNTSAKTPQKTAALPSIYEKLLSKDTTINMLYNGFAEYGHQLKLVSTKTVDGNLVYKLSGMVEDVSGGDSNRDYTLEIRYVIYKNGIVQYIDKGDMMLDNRYKQIELIRGSLAAGNTWTQKVYDSKDKKDVTLNCTVENISHDNGKKVYTIKYKDTNSKYYEIRKIKEDTGIINVMILYSYNDNGQMAYEEIGYSRFQ